HERETFTVFECRRSGPTDALRAEQSQFSFLHLAKRTADLISPWRERKALQFSQHQRASPHAKNRWRQNGADSALWPMSDSVVRSRIGHRERSERRENFPSTYHRGFARQHESFRRRRAAGRPGLAALRPVGRARPACRFEKNALIGLLH